MFIHSLLIQDRFVHEEKECILTILSPFEAVSDIMNQWVTLGNNSYRQIVETLSHHFNLINSDILKTKTININTFSLEVSIEVDDKSRLHSFEVGPIYELTKTCDDESVDYDFAWSAKLFSLE